MACVGHSRNPYPLARGNRASRCRALSHCQANFTLQPARFRRGAIAADIPILNKGAAADMPPLFALRSDHASLPAAWLFAAPERTGPKRQRSVRASITSDRHRSTTRGPGGAAHTAPAARLPLSTFRLLRPYVYPSRFCAVLGCGLCRRLWLTRSCSLPLSSSTRQQELYFKCKAVPKTAAYADSPYVLPLLATFASASALLCC